MDWASQRWDSRRLNFAAGSPPIKIRSWKETVGETQSLGHLASTTTTTGTSTPVPEGEDGAPSTRAAGWLCWGWPCAPPRGSPLFYPRPGEQDLWQSPLLSVSVGFSQRGAPAREEETGESVIGVSALLAPSLRLSWAGGIAQLQMPAPGPLAPGAISLPSFLVLSGLAIVLVPSC